MGCLSWIRAYDLGSFGNVAPRELLDAAAATGLALTPVDSDALEFFDIQALRQGHVARARLAPVELTGTVTLPGADGASAPVHLRGQVVTHLLLHRAGLLVIRPTIRFDRFDVDRSVSVVALHALERGIWSAASDLAWHLTDLDTPLTGYVRNYMNYVFLDLVARWSGERSTPRQLAAWSVERAHGCERLHELVAAGTLHHPYPVSFGTEIEVVLPTAPGESTVDWAARVAELAAQVMRPAHRDLDSAPSDVEPDADRVGWFVDENMALLVRAEGALDPVLDLVDRDRGQITEFLALRRGALTSIQRSTQRVLTERLSISRDQLAHWQNLVATLTDDYVLHSGIGRLLEPLKRHYAREPRLRDLNDLERQVRENLDWFQARLEAGAEWTGGLVGAAVGAAALALSLTEPVRIGLAYLTHTPVDQVADRYGLALAAAIVVVVALSFVGSLLFVRHLSNRLRPTARREHRPELSRRRRIPRPRGVRPPAGRSAVRR